MDVLFESLPTMLRYTVIMAGGIGVMEHCRTMALGYACEPPRVRDGWLPALISMGFVHLIGTVSPIPFSAVWWVSITEAGRWFVIWPRLLGISCAWFVAGWYGHYLGARGWMAHHKRPLDVTQLPDQIWFKEAAGDAFEGPCDLRSVVTMWEMDIIKLNQQWCEAGGHSWKAFPMIKARPKKL